MQPRHFWLTLSLFLLVVFALLLGLNMRRGLNHDEHQFLASGKLAAQGLLPYRDYPYFHAPTLSLIYGVLFRWFDPLLLTARLFSVICSWLALAVIGGQALRPTLRLHWPWRLLLVISAVLLLLAAPLFSYTSGRAWNHDLPVLIMVLAVVGYGQGWGGVSGFLIGLAASVRLSFAFLAPAFLLTIWWEFFWGQGGKGAKGQGFPWRLCTLATLRFVVAFLLGFAPALWLWALAPASFLFGNVEYVRLNTLYYRGLSDLPMTMTAVGKLTYLFRLFTQEWGNLFLGTSFIITLLPIPYLNPSSLRQAQATGVDAVNPRAVALLRLIISALFFMLIGALIATPSQAQYFYVLCPLLTVGIVYALSSWGPTAQRWGILGLSAMALVAAVLAIPQYAPGAGDLLTPTAWYPHKLHRRAQTLATLVGAGKVLTLAPLYPLEGNVLTYPALATGSFAWRVTPLVEPGRRERLGLFDPAQLTQSWQVDPPRGVLVGSEADDAAAEAVLIALAQEKGYVPVEVLDKQTLWLSPLAEWGGAIRLGAHTLPTPLPAPGEAFQVVFYLQKVGPLDRNLNILVRVVGDDGAELLRQEGWPWGSATSAWPQGEVWPDGHELVIPAEARAGVYGVEVSFYDPGTFEPLGEAVRVGQVEVR